MAIPEAISYSRDLVFAAACAAQRINGEYVKRAYTPFVPYRTYGRYRNDYHAPAPAPKVDPNGTKLYNSAVMKAILASDRNDILPEDYERAEEVRSYFCSLITLVFDGNAKDFVKSAVDAATSEEIATNDKLFGVTASLPSIYQRDLIRKQQREVLSTLTDVSIPLDERAGTTVRLNATVIDAIYKERWGSTAVNVMVNNLIGNRVVFFFSKDNWVKGSTYNISGRIKAKGNQTTQLHYVRQITDKEQ